MSEDTIAKLLTLGSLDSVEAQRRAALMVEDFRWIDFDTLSFSAQAYPHLHPSSREIIAIPIPEYRFGDTGFSINNAQNPEENVAEWLGGTGLDRGHLQLFSIVSIAARQMIPHYWLKAASLRHALRNPPQHLNMVEQIWWLKRWRGVEDVEMDAKLVPGANADVDWRLKFHGSLFVNVEVKRIPSDCVRHARGRVFSSDWFSRFAEKKVLSKFHHSSPSEINVLALSLFGELDREVQLALSDWLAKQQDVVDAIIMATRESRRRSGFDLQMRNEKAQLLSHLVLPPDEEDRTLAFAFEVPVSIPGIPSPSKV